MHSLNQTPAAAPLKMRTATLPRRPFASPPMPVSDWSFSLDSQEASYAVLKGDVMMHNAVQSPRRVGLLRLGALLMVLFFVGLWLWQTDRSAQAVRELAEPQRRALYERTIENLRSVCEPAQGPQLSDYCYQQAEFVLQFPECDLGCQELAHHQYPGPTR